MRGLTYCNSRQLCGSLTNDEPNQYRALLTNTRRKASRKISHPTSKGTCVVHQNLRCATLRTLKICRDLFSNLDACSACLQPPPTILQPKVRSRFRIQINSTELKLYHRENFRILGLNVRMHQL